MAAGGLRVISRVDRLETEVLTGSEGKPSLAETSRMLEREMDRLLEQAELQTRLLWALVVAVMGILGTDWHGPLLKLLTGG